MSDYIPREYHRSTIETPIKYALAKSGGYRCSRTLNYSTGGLCFEIDQKLAPEAEICVVMENYAPDHPGPERYRSYLTRARWIQPRSADPDGGFVTGTLITACSHEVLIATEEERCHICDQCGALIEACRLHQTDKNAQLCSTCHEHYCASADGKISACVERFLIGNVV